jgi:hypothetical protein
MLAALQQPEQRITGHALGFVDNARLPGPVCDEVATAG